jgi:hypothetical protein
VDGWLVASDVEMVDRLRELVEHDDLRHRMSEHNRNTPCAMTWANALDRTDAAYAEARAAKGGTGPSVLLTR